MSDSLPSVLSAKDLQQDGTVPVIDVTYFITYLFQLLFKAIINLIYYFFYLLKTILLSILSTTFQITFSAHTIVYVLLIISGPLYAYIRYTYLTVYSRLPTDSKIQRPTLDTFINNTDNTEQNQNKSYLDKFLSAIKIFGYLDPLVFHELTKSLQTQKIDSGEVIFLDECAGFSICVEGEIQVYSKISDNTKCANDENVLHGSMFTKTDTHNVVIIDGVKYQLLNIIKSGAPLSSFIAVLNLLTDNHSTLASLTPTPHFVPPKSLPSLPSDNFYLDPTQKPTPEPTHISQPNAPELIAIPKNKCTISMIPKESFTKIAQKYPKDASHIIQMILTKLYRVTFQTAHNFLDLTPNIYQTEININRYTNTTFSNYLKNFAIDHIETLNSSNDDNESVKRKKNVSKRKKKSRRSTFVDSPLYSDSSSINLSVSKKNKPLKYPKKISLNNVYSSENSASVVTTEDEIENENESLAMTDSSIASRNESQHTPRMRLKRNKSRYLELDNNRSSANPGDLLSNVPLPRNKKVNLNPTLSRVEIDELNERIMSGDNDETEEETLRNVLATQIMTLIGLDKGSFLVQRSDSLISQSINSPLMTSTSNIGNGIRYITPVDDNLKGRYNKLRTYSTTNMSGLSNTEDTSSVKSEIFDTVHNFENIKSEFANDIKFFKISKDTHIIKSNEQTPGIFFIIDGSFEVTYSKKEGDYVGTYLDECENDMDSSEKVIEEYLYTLGSGEIAGYLGTLVGSKSFVDVKANTDSYVAFFSREFFNFLVERYPGLQLGIAKLLLKVLDKKLYLTDYALEWIHSSAGEVLYRQMDPANGIYIVLNGRLRAVSENKDDGKLVVMGEFGQGESMGEIEVLTKSKRLNTVVSIRDSELARIPRTLFEIISLSNPSIMVNISRIVASRVKNDGKVMASNMYISATASTRIKDEPIALSSTNYRTLTLLPTTYGTVPLTEFAEQLSHALEKVGKTVKVLNQSAALSNLGKYAFDKLAKLKQSGYFSELEAKFDIVIYLCDSSVNSNWTSTCIQQGDCVLLLADSMQSPDVGEYERLLVKSRTTARTELVLLHPDRYIEPGSTHKWLKNRIWVHSHHHLQMQCNTRSVDIEVKSLQGKGQLLSLGSRKMTENIISKVESIVNNTEFLHVLKKTNDFKSKKYYQPLQEHKDDFMRLARLLTGQGIGLVLGGGGARGISHVGIIKALEDNGIPVDIIGGTSIGAFVGGLYAKEYDFVPVYGRAKIFAGRMGSLWRSLLDLTIPLTSYLTGHEFNRGLWKAFGDSRIEDFWIKYYANSTNLTDSVMEVHTSGYAWRYIRASMTLASLLPPITDEGKMLLDGGYIDNLTVTEMQRQGAKHIIAVDVGSVDDRSPMEYGNSLSGWWVLINRLNPFSVHANVPTMADIQMRLAYVASVNALQRAKTSKGCSYLRPPIEAYATLAFGKFDQIYDVGFKYGDEKVKGILKEWNLNNPKKKEFHPGRRTRRRYSL
ncbi:hypothetical protein CANINC_000848 [Pichia inconspicua]|uniref:Lysophospholipase NTE1 n=1 Tax=Pichia inconspicua TaxID=52247 RepID=A0A4T0X5B3_9ASCO|nr:hypothetical protein CANINC_000848 [[Candida] inconspicua]